MGNALENWGGRRIPEPPTQPAPERGDGGESDHLVSNRRLQAKGLRDPIGPCVVPWAKMATVMWINPHEYNAQIA